MWVVYIIQNNQTLETYIGVSGNLNERLKTHNAKGRKFTTRKNGVWVLIYAEAYRSKKDVLQREKRLKHHANGKIELFKRLKNSMLDTKIEEGRSESLSGDCLLKTQLPANS